MAYLQLQDGRKLYYEEEGAGKPVVFIHGWKASANVYEDTSRRLAEAGYRAIRYDHVGHMRSDLPDFEPDLKTLADDLQRMEQIMPGQLYNMHPGSHVGQGAETAIGKIADTLNAVLRPEQTTTLLLETMAGKGSEVGRTFEELAAIIDRVELSDHVGVCLDTCHVWDGGYDIAADLDGVLEQFDRVLGIGRLRAVHLNDSKNPCGAHKDRHEKLGLGHIGIDALAAVVNHPFLRDLPFYLETPHDELSGYAGEIERLKELRTL
jgi:deoxyribonuclease-4